MGVHKTIAGYAVDILVAIGNYGGGSLIPVEIKTLPRFCAS